MGFLGGLMKMSPHLKQDRRRMLKQGEKPAQRIEA